ncbi:uncharacterized protein LOC134432928 [Melospiza melodia melodia]|uniref:uncharacterized protein LOC134432928 n=1 Tax=Melospiza melodia melodia TaxID=1914991 RepID=UPI002FD07183
METKELSPAMLQAQVTVVATLGELLDTLPTRDEEETLHESSKRLHRGLEEFTQELWVTLQRTENTWRRHIVTDDDDGGVTSLSQALAAYKSTPQSTQDRVAMAASEWQRLVAALKNSWAKLVRKATELRDTCRVAVTEAAATQAREMQDQAARDGTALERMGELAQALGGEEGAEVEARPESPVRREARVAAIQATRATTERERLEAALGLLERLVAACDEATAFLRELQRLLRDTETTLEGTKKKSPDVLEDSEATRDEAVTFRSSPWHVFRHPKATLKGRKKKFPDVPEDLVAKVDEAERLWEANTRLAKDHLLWALHDITKFYFHGGSAGTNALEVAERCQRAIEDISRLLRTPEHPQSVPKVSPVSTEPQEMSPAMLQSQVTVVAILGELLETLPTQEEEEMLLKSSKRLQRGLKEFTKELRVALRRIDDTWRRHIVTLDDDDGGVTSLSRALAAYESTPGISRDDVARAASEWQRSVNFLVDRWAELVRKATKLRDTLIKVAAKALIAELREQQDEAPRYKTYLGHRVELGQARGGEEGTEVVARTESPVRRKARVAASEETTATMVRQRVEVAVGPLQCLVAACDEAAAFPRELQRLLGDTKIALKGRKKKFPNVPEDLVAKVAEAERLWETNARLAKDHLVGIIDDFLDYYSRGGRARPSAREVAKRCQRVIEDIPNLLQDDDVTAMTS